MKISRQKVDPQLATEWLGYNTHNRNHRSTVVAQYTEAMANGDWGNDIDPIAFAGELGGKGKKAPVLLNGQHRLFALVSADITVEFIVIEGLELSDQVEMDAGVKRQLADQLRLMKDMSYPIETASVLRLVYAYDHNLLRSRNSASYAALLRYLDEHPDLPESILPARRVMTAVGGRVSVWGAAHYILSCIEDPSIEEDVAEFFDAIISGENLPGGSPLLALRSQIMQMTTNARVGNRRGAMGQVTQLAITLKAWNAWREGVTLHTLSWRGGGKHPEGFPVPA